MKSMVSIAMRNVKRQKRRSNLLAAAIAFGVMMITLVNALTTGLVQTTQTNFESLLGGHVYITGEVMLNNGKAASRIGNPQLIDSVLPSVEPYVLEVQKRSQIEGKFIFRSNVTTQLLYGVDWERESSLPDSFHLVSGSLDALEREDAIVITDTMAEDLQVEIGEEILVSFETVTGQANVASFTVGVIIEETSILNMSTTYGSIGYINRQLGLEADEYQYMNLYLRDIRMIPVVKNALDRGIESAGGLLKQEEESDQGSLMVSAFGIIAPEEPWEGTRFRVSTLNEFMDAVTQVVAVLQGISLGVFMIMLIITMVGLVNTFQMIMIERVKEIGTLRAVGMLKKDVSRLFILEGIFLVLRGAVFGIAAALLISLASQLFTFPSDSSFAFILDGGKISVRLEPLSILLTLVIVTLITVISVWRPARKAARISPADALRA